jgi:hypothetical protein
MQVENMLILQGFLIGATGFEPATSWSRTSSISDNYAEVCQAEILVRIWQEYWQFWANAGTIPISAVLVVRAVFSWCYNTTAMRSQWIRTSFES